MPAVLPQTMTAVGFDAPGRPDVLRVETLPLPGPAPGEVLEIERLLGGSRGD